MEHPRTMSITEKTPGAFDILKKYYPGGHCGVDKQGRLVFIQPFGTIDLKGILFSVHIDDLLAYKRRQGKMTQDVIKALEEKDGTKIEGGHTTFVIDMEGLNRKTLWLTGFKKYQSVIDQIEKEFPEGCAQVLVINTPAVMQGLLAKIFGGKTKILSSKWKTEILDYIDPSQLPRHYGGSKLDSKGSGKCEEFICYGGRVPQDLYQLGQADLSDFDEVRIKSGSKHIAVREVNADNQRLHYQFMTTDGDIGFTVKFRQFIADAAGGKPDDDEILISLQKISSNMVLEDGELECDKKGEYLFVFDNSTSLLKKRALKYKIDLINMEEF